MQDRNRQDGDVQDRNRQDRDVQDRDVREGGLPGGLPGIAEVRAAMTAPGSLFEMDEAEIRRPGIVENYEN